MTSRFAQGEPFDNPEVRSRRDDRKRGGSQTANMKAAATDQWFLKEWRKARGLSQDALAEAIETSKGYISDLERGNRPYNSGLAKKLARALGITVPDLLTVDPNSPAAQLFIPIMGRVGADNEGRDIQSTGQGPLGYAPRLPSGSAEAGALYVVGDSMKPALENGMLIYFEEQSLEPTRDMIGKMVIVETEDGRVLVKRLLRGNEKGLWDLESLSGPTLQDVKIRWASHISAILPPHVAARLVKLGEEAN